MKKYQSVCLFVALISNLSHAVLKHTKSETLPSFTRNPLAMIIKRNVKSESSLSQPYLQLLSLEDIKLIFSRDLEVNNELFILAHLYDLIIIHQIKDWENLKKNSFIPVEKFRNREN